MLYNQENLWLVAHILLKLYARLYARMIITIADAY